MENLNERIDMEFEGEDVDKAFRLAHQTLKLMKTCALALNCENYGLRMRRDISARLGADIIDCAKLMRLIDPIYSAADVEEFYKNLVGRRK